MLSRNMKTRLLATVSSIALAGGAIAADYPVKARPLAPAAPWTGFYLGLNTGAAWHHWAHNDVNNFLSLVPGLTGPTVFDNNEFWSGTKAAFTFGGQAGYNWQSSNLVYGIEADLNWVNAKSDTSFPDRILAFGNVIASTKMDWLATVRGRLGVTFSPTMVYLTGGFALAHVKDYFSATGFPSNAIAATNDKTLAGYAIGAGVEHMLSSDWSVKAEALYVGLKNTSGTAFRAGNTYQTEFKHSAVLARLGINRKFSPK